MHSMRYNFTQDGKGWVENGKCVVCIKKSHKDTFHSWSRNTKHKRRCLSYHPQYCRASSPFKIGKQDASLFDANVDRLTTPPLAIPNNRYIIKENIED